MRAILRAVATPALSPERYLRSVAASATTLGKPHVKLVSLAERVRSLTRGSPCAIVGGLAQVLWARKTHTDDFDVAVAAADLARAAGRVRRGDAPRGWKLPKGPLRAHESDDVFEVWHLLYRGSAVDLLAFHDRAFMAEILSTAQAVPEVGGHRFIRPELLLVTHLLRPTVGAALAAVELLVVRRGAGDFDESYARRWAARMKRVAAFDRTVARAAELTSG